MHTSHKGVLSMQVEIQLKKSGIRTDIIKSFNFGENIGEVNLNAGIFTASNIPVSKSSLMPIIGLVMFHKPTMYLFIAKELTTYSRQDYIFDISGSVFDSKDCYLCANINTDESIRQFNDKS